MSQEFVVFRGRRMIAGWPEQIQAAQAISEYRIGDNVYGRIRYGDESDDWGADLHSCHDCAVEKGEYHVPGCDAEECPICHGAIFSCDCDDPEGAA